MKWQNKARMQRVFDRMPGGARLYQQVQRRLGAMTSDPTDRLGLFEEMLQWMADAGLSPVGVRGLEVGTGHKASLPMLFGLCGAESVHTIDLNRRLQVDVMGSAIEWVQYHAEELVTRLSPYVEEPVVRERISRLVALRAEPLAALAAVGVSYDAPGDAAAVPLDDGSVDIHFSTTTLEHIPADVLGQILAEAARLLSDRGMAVHLVDLSDHFAHQDPTITRSNFLQFSPARWERLAGNEFGYCNRLRAEEYRALFEEAGLLIERWETKIDRRSLDALNSGELQVDPCFGDCENEELATDYLAILARGAGLGR
ncbi:MAG TPA: class I SAM-dependent methyltransferase [Acidimicrobiales bacterium]|nr:class I SAM-dependent methyltransferase [Acidimicrobiales bacterium]